MRSREQVIGEVAYQQAQKMHATMQDKEPLTREVAIATIKEKCPFVATSDECEAALSKSLFAAMF